MKSIGREAGLMLLFIAAFSRHAYNHQASTKCVQWVFRMCFDVAGLKS